MSHDIDESTGKPAMAYVGAEPWHELGERLPAGQSIEVWMRAARLDWRIQMVPVQYAFGGRARIMRTRFVLTRDDTGAALSVVSADYQVVQPAEVLEFYRDLVAQRHYTLETAGALDGGRKVWALARTGMVANIAGNAADQLGAYVLLATSCDKTLATTVSFTPQSMEQFSLATRHLFDKAFIRVLVRRLHAAHEAAAHPRRIL